MAPRKTASARQVFLWSIYVFSALFISFLLLPFGPFLCSPYFQIFFVLSLLFVHFLHRIKSPSKLESSLSICVVSLFVWCWKIPLLCRSREGNMQISVVKKDASLKSFQWKSLHALRRNQQTRYNIWARGFIVDREVISKKILNVFHKKHWVLCTLYFILEIYVYCNRYVLFFPHLDCFLVKLYQQ
jgi:hypothetical protein